MENVVLILVFIALGVFSVVLIGLAAEAALDIWGDVLDRFKRRY